MEDHIRHRNLCPLLKLAVFFSLVISFSGSNQCDSLESKLGQMAGSNMDQTMIALFVSDNALQDSQVESNFITGYTHTPHMHFCTHRPITNTDADVTFHPLFQNKLSGIVNLSVKKFTFQLTWLDVHASPSPRARSKNSDNARE